MDQRNKNLYKIRYGHDANFVEDPQIRANRSSELDKLLKEEKPDKKISVMGADSVFPEKDINIVKNLINKCADLIEVMNTSTREIFKDELSRLKEVIQ